MPVNLDVVTIEFMVAGATCPANVRRVRYVEGLSELCEADVILALAKDAAAAIVPEAVVRLTISRGDSSDHGRHICGIVESVEHLDQGDGMSMERPLLRLRIVPKVWRTSMPKRSRVFLKVSIDDVLSKVLGESGLTMNGTVSTVPHPIIVQYQETDLALMSRLLEEAGATHVVEHASSGDTWRVFHADPGLQQEPLARTLVWTSLASGEADVDGVVRAGRVDAMGAKTHAVSDIDRRVDSSPWAGRASGRGHAAVREQREPWRVPGEGVSAKASRLTDEQRPELERFWLETSDMLVKAGERIDAELSRADSEAGVLTELRVVRTEHEIETSQDGVVYRNRVEAVRSNKPFRPARVTPRPCILAPQTGIVQSFNEEKMLEVYVLMDWGQDDHNFLPVRMTQPLAGTNHGVVLVPAVNSEVLVHFIDGVPERPVLIGALYHKTAEASVAAGLASKESSFQSRLTMLGDRGPTNVIEVDDATNGSELIKMKAINDVEVKILRNEKREVGGTLDDTITGDVTVELGAKRTTHVTDDETYSGDKNISVTVQQSGRVLFNNSLQMTADTKLSLISGNTRADFSPSAAKITVGGTVIEMTAAGIKMSVGGSSVELNAGMVKIAGSLVNINNGALTVM